MKILEHGGESKVHPRQEMKKDHIQRVRGAAAH